MNRVNYLKLMTKTYFNTFDVMFEDVEFLQFPFEYRKNQFVKQIERKQKSLNIPLKEFVEDFDFALVFLKDEILKNIHKHIKQTTESELNEIRNGEEIIYVPLQCVNTSLTDYLCIKDIDYIKKCFNSFICQPNPNPTETETNPYPLIFVNETVYKCFLDYKKHIIDVHTDYSYLKKRLEKLKFIHKHTDKDFMKFLFEDIKFISKKDLEDFDNLESKLKSLEKSYSVQRENNFNIIFKSLL